MTHGVLTLAQNSTVDYVRLAYLQCLSLRLTNPGLPYSIITDAVTYKDIPQSVHDAVDHLVVLPTDLAYDQTWKQRNECQLFQVTPFRETIKVEADLLFTGSISHWWHGLRTRDVVISSGCVDYRGNTATDRRNRRAFDANGLPDVYTGLMYWRRSRTAQILFQNARDIYMDWDRVRSGLLSVPDADLGSTDLVFALAARLTGEHLVTLPMDHFRMVHLKNNINGWVPNIPWYHQTTVDIAPPEVRIAGFQQTHPVHYQDKDWATDQLIEDYQRVVMG